MHSPLRGALWGRPYAKRGVEAVEDERTADRMSDMSTGNEVSGVVAGSSVQAGAISGGVHFHNAGGTAGVPIPRQLLSPSAHFTNRVSELAALDGLLSRMQPGIVVLSGAGGVGKTALALSWAHRVRERFPDGHLYVDLAGFSDVGPLDPSEVLASFLRALGVPPPQVPLELAEQAALYRSVTAGRSLLVLLDNAFSVAQVRVLLPGPSASAVVVTSRNRLAGLFPDGASLIEVGPLPETDALSLLGRVVGAERVTKEWQRAEALVGLCGGLPLAVCLAAARLAARPRLTLARLATDFVEGTERLTALSAGEGTTVQAAFDSSYRFLSPAAAALYRRLSLHPGLEFGAEVIAMLALRQASAAGAEGMGDPLEELVGASLLEELPEDRFRFHDLLRLHARQRAGADDSEEVQRAAVLSMLEWYLASAAAADLTLTPYRRRLPYVWVSRPDVEGFADRGAALEWFERERSNLISAGRVALDQGWPELAWRLCDVMWPLLLYRRHYRDRVEIDRRGVEAARAWGNKWAEADMLKRLGLICTTVGIHDEAEPCLRESMRLCDEIGDPRGAADAKEGLALLHVATGGLDEAADAFQELIPVYRGLDATRNVGLTLINLGFVLPRLGRPQEAVELLRKAKEIFDGLSAEDPYNGARVVVALTGAHLGAGEIVKARESGVLAARLMRGLGSTNGEAEALEALGEVAHREGDHRAAERHLRQALEIFLALGSSRAESLRGRLREVAGHGGLTNAEDGASPSPRAGREG